ncbi:MAG: heavy metal translocating P-type ATPase [Ruminococcus sp.]|nr:heavy metal translocating P-type ATPase [Ruminococcus sp.]
MEQYNVGGMSCAACSARVEKAVSSLDGVTSCSVSLLTNSMGVEGTAKPQDIIEAVEKAGYTASVKGNDVKATENRADSLKDTESPKILKRLAASLGFLLVLMYFSMGHSMLGLPLPGFFSGNHVAIGLVQLLLAAAVMVINQKFFISGFKGLIHRAPNMDTLVALGSGTAFAYSTAALFLMTGEVMRGNGEAAHALMHELYFESSAMILTLITVGKLLEAKSKGRTTNALKSLMDLSPKKAVVIRNGVETEVNAEAVKKGDIFVVRPGESIPADGVVLEGETAVDESMLTGESVPVDKSAGSAVSAATINRSGFIRCEATKVGDDTTLSQIIKMVSDAAATKAPIAKIADKVSSIFVPAVITIAVITFAVWMITGAPAGTAIARAISVLVISCPCALGLATPVAIMVGSGVGARNGILFKTAVSLEETGKIKVAALDKTGTITQGKPVVTDIAANGISEEALLAAAASLEAKSEHPLAQAIIEEAKNKGISILDTEEFSAVPGRGLTARINGETVRGGNQSFTAQFCEIPKSVKQRADELANQGKTPLFFSKGNKFLGAIAVADVIKPDSRSAVSELKKMGIRTVMLTGDNEKTARAIGAQAGVDEVIAGVLPDGKESVVRKLMQKGKTAMAGDGINDAPALTTADVGIAIGAGADVAIEAADVVLINSNLSDVPAAIKLGRATLKNIYENLFWAFIYNIIGIPLAAGLFTPLLGWQMNPMFGAAAMSLSSFCVVTNALRLNFVKLKPKQKTAEYPEAQPEIITEEKENDNMKTKISIEGMMCPHCEARVKTALEAVPGVESADVSHKKGAAKVKLSAEVPFDTLKAAVEEAGYKVID